MYKEVIDKLLSMGSVEKERVAINLAKHHPNIFLKMCEEEGKEEEVMLDNDIVFIINALNAGRRVDAAKGVREYWGHDFHDSLDIVKVYDGDKDIILSPAQTATLNKLNRVAKVLKG